MIGGTMKTLTILFIIFFAFGFIIKGEEPEKPAAKKQANVEFTKKNFVSDLNALDFALKELERGDAFFSMGYWKYVDALPHYLNAYEINPNNAELNYKIGKSYLMTYDKFEAQAYLESAYALDQNVSSDVQFLLAQAYHYNYEFEKAIVFYNSFLNSLDRRSAKLYREDVELRIAQARNGIELMASPKPITVEALGTEVNSVYPDYCPVLLPDGSGIMFTSRRSNTTGGSTDERDYKYNEDIYAANGQGSSLSPAFNTGILYNSETHDATVGISSDGNTLLIYRGDNGGDLYYMHQEAGQWGALTRMDKNINTEGKESSACLTQDGSRLYFTSDRSGGYGGMDIWYSDIQQDGTWGVARNLGPVINSPQDEESVNLSADGLTLYFSSKGHSSMGGYDVFSSLYEDNEWTRPANLGYPLNTPDDDVFFTVSNDESYGYFSSERIDGEGSQDIYLARLRPEPNRILMLRGMVVDNVYHETIDLASVSIVDEEGVEVAYYENLGLGTSMFSLNLDPSKSYYIHAVAPGFNSATIKLEPETYPSGGGEMTRVVELPYLNVSRIALPYVYFDFDKTFLRTQAIADLDGVVNVMKTYQSAMLLIGGHTDVIGSWEYNKSLSLERAKVVRNYLISQGVEESRLRIEWFSYDLPVGDNTSDVGRQMNRRTELRLIAQ